MDKPIVTKRNHFTSLELFIEDALGDWRGEEKAISYRDMANFLMRYSEHLMHSLAGDFTKAAQQGIEQATRLIADPNYYETKKQRRERENQRAKDWQARQDQETWRRRFEPRPEEIAAGIAACERDIDWHSSRLNQANTRLLELKALQAELPPVIDEELITDLKM